jgi:hypothetical protein
LIAFIKKQYQRPFRAELFGFELLFTYALTKLLSFAYTLMHIRHALSAHKKVAPIKVDIVNNKKSVFVFANGPSLGDIDFSKIKRLMASGRFDLIAINSFLSQSAHEIIPTFAVFADNRFFDDAPENERLRNDRKICAEKSVIQLLPFQNASLTDPMQIGYNSMCDVYGSNTSNILLSPGFYGLTALHALRLALHLKYEKVYICGFDNSYFKDFEVLTSGKMVIRHRHYYDGAETNIDVPCIYDNTADFFFDTYKHFFYIEKIANQNPNIVNIARTTYLAAAARDTGLDLYKNNLAPLH